MAGIYIHIPFCRQKCFYCDFYKTVNANHTQQFLSSLLKEIEERKSFIVHHKIETIYFGGGTPSTLNKNELESILGALKLNFEINDTVEITFEANPDDLTCNYLQDLLDVGINRLSIGIQSFQDKHLKKLNRRHNAKQAILAIENAVNLGFTNISVDLIYGLPNLSENEWISDLNQFFKLPVQHLSAYHLTYHEGTPFYSWLKKGTLNEINESESISQFNSLIDLAEKNGFEQYEISNFAREAMYSRHNSSYWMGKKYLGLGPSAHSYNGISRRWNVSDVEKYIKAITNDLNYSEEEVLNENERFNEYILTRIRTKWGVVFKEIEIKFGANKLKHFLVSFEKYRKSNLATEKNGIVTLTKEGLFISDEIMADLMII